MSFEKFYKEIVHYDMLESMPCFCKVGILTFCIIYFLLLTFFFYTSLVCMASKILALQSSAHCIY